MHRKERKQQLTWTAFCISQTAVIKAAEQSPSAGVEENKRDQPACQSP